MFLQKVFHFLIIQQHQTLLFSIHDILLLSTIFPHLFFIRNLFLKDKLMVVVHFDFHLDFPFPDLFLNISCFAFNHLFHAQEIRLDYLSYHLRLQFFLLIHALRSFQHHQCFRISLIFKSFEALHHLTLV